jgi:hypothetical protein
MSITSSSLETEISGAIREVVNQYLTIKWMYQGYVVVFTVSGPLAVQDVAHTWHGAVKRILAGWPAAQPYLAIYDISRTNFTMTPQVMGMMRDMYALRPELIRRVATVGPTILASQLLRAAVRTQEADNLEWMVFNRREEAVRWLLPYASQAMQRH